MPQPPSPSSTAGADLVLFNGKIITVDANRPDKQLVRGEMKWYADFDECIRYFVEHQGCAVCLPICPWSRPGVASRLAEKMTRRMGVNRT